MSKISGWKAVCAIFLLCAATAIAVRAQTLTTLENFDGTNGASPVYGLVQGTDGNFYGAGGAVVFRMTPEGTLTTLQNFGSAEGVSALVLANDGNFYGTTFYVGVVTSACMKGSCGTVFKITPEGTLTTLHTFNSSNSSTDGSKPYAGLVQGTDGNLYGTTFYGGDTKNCYQPYGCGTVFKITPGGTLTTLHIFNGNDGAHPQASLVLGTDGNFYGTMLEGGACGSCGTVFKITPGGTLTTLHYFDYFTDGSHPARLLQATDGNLYGTTEFGAVYGDGTVFKITPAGTLTILHSFNSTDGALPVAGLVQATDGSFYGTTSEGGSHNGGTIFRITPKGTLTTLHSFDCAYAGCLDGAHPNGELVQASSGIFYGTTFQGGTYGLGTVFSLSMGFGPFVSLIRNSGIVGATAQILGQGFTGTTEVSFNGTPAAFTVESDTYLTATVPAGAATGFVTVATPGGTLKSNKKFRVTPQILRFSPTSGPVGTKVVITGESFTGASGVTLACKWPMSFTVDSDTQITAIVPADGTTGELMVSGTPGGHVESTGSFTVTD